MAQGKIPNLPPIQDSQDLATFNDVVLSFHELRNMHAFVKENKLLNCDDDYLSPYYAHGIQVWRALFKLKKIIDAQSK
jgi:hypothetical protein